MMSLNKRYTWLWAIWIALFGVIEWRAIKDKRPGDTLSEHVWKLIGKREYQKQGAWLLWRIGLGGLLVWLIAHFFGGA
jgi:hypothetical protein